jgi:hypothetical protein
MIKVRFFGTKEVNKFRDVSSLEKFIREKYVSKKTWKIVGFYIEKECFYGDTVLCVAYEKDRDHMGQPIDETHILGAMLDYKKNCGIHCIAGKNNKEIIDKLHLIKKIECLQK